MSDFDLLIRGCPRPDDPEVIDVGIADGTIVEVGDLSGRTGREEISATDRWIWPGLVDSHVHFNEPGRADWEGLETGSKAAIAGGITTFFDMPLNSTPPVVTVEAFESKVRLAEKKSRADFGIWGGLIPGRLDEIEGLARAGVIGFKAFMVDSGLDEFPPADPATLREGMRRIAETGLRLALHAEAPDRLGDPGATVASFLASRPIDSEIAAIDQAIELASETECAVHIVHISNAAGIDRVSAAKRAGIDITCETCPHYLLLNDTALDEHGAVAKCAPPLRPERERVALRERFEGGHIDTLGSDHSPCLTSMKTGVAFDQAWGGISGIQNGLGLLLEGGFQPTEIQRTYAEAPARLFGLRRKGGLDVGRDADLLLIDPGRLNKINSDEILYRNPHTPYIGRLSKGNIESVYLRGRCVYRDGSFLGEPGGRLVRPDVT